MTIENLITDNIDIWTAAINKKSATGRGSSKKIELYGIKKLRELILELAVRGKLVPQDPNDEPASVLLERIAVEKAQLVKDKKIKTPKKLPEICEDEKPFKLPRGWTWTRLGDSGGTNVGLTYSPKDAGNVGTPVLRSTNIQKGKIDLNELVRVDMKVKESAYVNEGDLLICARNGSKALVGKTAAIPSLSEPMAFGAFMAIYRSPFNMYFEKFINSPVFRRNLTGVNTTTINQITQGNLRSTVAPVPPLAEQHRIVAKVDELMLLCDQLEQQTESSIDAHKTLVEVLLATLTDSKNANDLNQNWERVSEFFDTLFTTEHSIDQLKQTILQLAVMGKLVPQDPNDEPASKLLERIAAEKAQLIKDKKIKKQKALPEITDEEKPFELPDGWECERIGTFGIVGTGATPSRSNADYWEPAEINWVSSGETSNYFVGKTKEQVSLLAIKETNVSIYPIGTLVVAMYGQGKTRGQITELLEEAGTNQACAAIQLVEKSSAHKDYVKLFFRKAYIELRSHAAGGAQPNLNVGKISNTVISLPPLEEQCRIVTKVDELLNMCDQLKSCLNEAQQIQLHLADALIENTI